MQLVIRNKESVLVEKEVAFVTLPAASGDMKVLPGHAPTIALIREGKIVFGGSAETGQENIMVKKGLARITGKEVLVLIDQAK